jgi:hypothetical protein
MLNPHVLVSGWSHLQELGVCFPGSVNNLKTILDDKRRV